MKTCSEACHLKGLSKGMYIGVSEEGSTEILNIRIDFYIKYYHYFHEGVLMPLEFLIRYSFQIYRFSYMFHLEINHSEISKTYS